VRPSPLPFLVLCAAALLPSPARAACASKDTLVHFEGDIDGKLPIGMTVVFDGDKVQGAYYYHRHQTDIRVTGTVKNEKTLELSELDEHGQVSAVFHGTFSTPGCDKVEGTWESRDGARKLPFRLSLDYENAGSLDHRYMNAGAEDDALIERSAQSFCKAVRENDRGTVASLISFPLEIHTNGKRRTIANAKDFLAAYDSIFTPALKESIAKVVPHHMFTRSEGIMLGNGIVWLGPDGKVFTINR
jgi:hypothetical protein